MTILTYTGKLHKGKIELAAQVNLPEGSEVYVVVAPGIEQCIAKRKANGWLVDQIGNMVMADDGVLVQRGNTWAWRFYAYLTSLAHEPYGLVGYVDANTGAVLSDQQTVEAMYERGARYLRPA